MAAKRKEVNHRFTGRYAALMDGTLELKDLDVEELARGQLKDKNGRFTGSPPKALPVAMIKKMQAEFFRRGDKLFEDSYVDAVTIIGRIMRSPRVDPAVRLKAATYIVERVRGKAPEVVVIAGEEKPWQKLLASIIVGTPDEVDGALEITDAEVVSDEDDSL